jgi:hypothetical protein
MAAARRVSASPLAAAALAALALGDAAGLAPPLPRAEASVPTGLPVFSDPLAIDNAWVPFHEGGVKVYRGLEGRDRVTVLEQHLPTTRAFDWGGGTVECRTVRESKFEAGACAEISVSWFAQADDGSVWYFGEITEPLPALPGDPDPDPDDEPGDTESDGWVVGLASPADPPGTASATDPFLFMPANPERGDTWKPEDLPDVVDETDRVVRGGLFVRTAAGRFPGCIEIRETTIHDPGFETKWYAPGVGVVRMRGRGESLALQASTLLRR